MMKFKLNLDIPERVLNLGHNNSIVLIGSCFSDEMSSHFGISGHKVESNPFGTLFHPSSIANVIIQSLKDETSVDVVESEGLFYSWCSSRKIYAETKTELKEKVIAIRSSTKETLLNADLLVITFGTSWLYRLKSKDIIVGNCHKVPSSEFDKELTSVQTLLDEWKALMGELKELNPSLRVVFTVSPVRHSKDGLINNNRSKARLIELVHCLVEEYSNAFYFPSYEVLMDELRDYRFYAEDLVHPSKQAVSYIWNALEKFIFSEATEELNQKILSINAERLHVSSNPKSKMEKSRQAKLEGRIKRISEEHPEIYWQ